MYAKLGEKHVLPILDAFPPDDPRREALRSAQEALEMAAADWEAEATSELGSAEATSAEVLASSPHEPDEVSTGEVADMLAVSERRVCQMLAPGGALADAGRKVGRRWMVDRGAVVAYRQQRQEQAA